MEEIDRSGFESLLCYKTHRIIESLSGFIMDRFTVAVLSQTPNPQQTIYSAMHQDYSEEFVWADRDRLPSEAKCGELVVKHLLAGNRGHYGPLEHPQIVLNCGWFPHSTMQQIRTHRVGISFDVQCLAGDTEVTFVQASGALRKINIAELYDLWANGEKAVRMRAIRGRKGEQPGEYRRDCKARLQRMKLRVLNERTGMFETSHIQDVMCSGTQPVYRVTLADGKILDCTTNHRLFTSSGWQTMGDAVGLVTDNNHQVLAMTRRCEVMCNGVVRPDVLYTHRAWLESQAQKDLTAKAIAPLCNTTPDVIRYWARQFSIQLGSGRHRGSKRIVGNGLYREQSWLEARLAEGLCADEMAAIAGCSVESIKKWVYHYGLALNRRSPGTASPWNQGKAGQYSLNLTAEQRETRRENARKYTQRGRASIFWKGGVSSDRTLVSAWTRQTAPQVHEKFNYICQHCGQKGGALHAHHLVPVFANPDLAYEFENLVSVCKECHETIHHHDLEAAFAENFQPITQLTQ